MYSDNGTNFHDTDWKFQMSFQEMSSDLTLQVALANDNVQWDFILPTVPYFGGLWEAGVKRFKFHLRLLIVGSRTLSKIEFTTLLC